MLKREDIVFCATFSRTFATHSAPAGQFQHSPHHLRTDGWMSDSLGSENFLKVDIAAHEWLALAYYKLRGYSDEWFAGPETNSSPSDVVSSGYP